MQCVAVIQGVSCSDVRFTKQVRGCSMMQSAWGRMAPSFMEHVVVIEGVCCSAVIWGICCSDLRFMKGVRGCNTIQSAWGCMLQWFMECVAVIWGVCCSEVIWGVCCSDLRLTKGVWDIARCMLQWLMECVAVMWRVCCSDLGLTKRVWDTCKFTQVNIQTWTCSCCVFVLNGQRNYILKSSWQEVNLINYRCCTWIHMYSYICIYVCIYILWHIYVYADIWMRWYWCMYDGRVCSVLLQWVS